jgi:uncharacterized protein YndB with AHSA1/START domain
MTRSIHLTRLGLATVLAAFNFSAQLYAETAAVGCDATMMAGSIAQLSDNHATVHTSILINASKEDVWAALTDFDNMAYWSTGTLQSMSGDIRDGGKIEITFIFGTDGNGNPNTMTVPHTLIYEDGKMFGWSDPFSEDIGGGHDNHVYQVEAFGDQTRFVQSDEIVGNPFAANFVSQLMPMYQTFNAELKAAVEN